MTGARTRFLPEALSLLAAAAAFSAALVVSADQSPGDSRGAVRLDSGASHQCNRDNALPWNREAQSAVECLLVTLGPSLPVGVEPSLALPEYQRWVYSESMKLAGMPALERDNPRDPETGRERVQGVYFADGKLLAADTGGGGIATGLEDRAYCRLDVLFLDAEDEAERNFLRRCHEPLDRPGKTLHDAEAMLIGAYGNSALTPGREDFVKKRCRIAAASDGFSSRRTASDGKGVFFTMHLADSAQLPNQLQPIRSVTCFKPLPTGQSTAALVFTTADWEAAFGENLALTYEFAPEKVPALASKNAAGNGRAPASAPGRSTP